MTGLNLKTLKPKGNVYLFKRSNFENYSKPLWLELRNRFVADFKLLSGEILSIIEKVQAVDEIPAESLAYLTQLLNAFLFILSFFRGRVELAPSIVENMLEVLDQSLKFSYFSRMFYYCLSNSLSDQPYEVISKDSSFSFRVGDQVIPGPDLPYGTYHRGKVVQIKNGFAYVEWDSEGKC